jgi:hypothetical protein
MENKGRIQILKGMKYMGIAIFLMFLGPILLSIGFRALNDGIYIWLVLGILISTIAIIMAFMGIKNIVKGLFKTDA